MGFRVTWARRKLHDKPRVAAVLVVLGFQIATGEHAPHLDRFALLAAFFTAARLGLFAPGAAARGLEDDIGC